MDTSAAKSRAEPVNNITTLLEFESFWGSGGEAKKGPNLIKVVAGVRRVKRIEDQIHIRAESADFCTSSPIAK
jgi:hypothetical protein